MSNEKAVMHGEEYFENEKTAVWTWNNTATAYSSHVDRCIEEASNLKSKLPDEATIKSVISGVPDQEDIPYEHRLMGFSGVCFRHFMNNLCAMNGANYLEVGTFRGSSLVSAVYGNTGVLNEIHAIDNFSEFIVEESGFHPRDDLHKNFNLYLGPEQEKINFYEEDCFSFDLSKLPKIQLYFYDGEHSRESQKKAFTYFEPIFDDVIIVVVDDWEQRQVRLGTLDGLAKINYDVISSRAIIPGKRPENANRVNNPDAYWWSGTYVAILKKRGT